jgi:hypothetical protein
MKPIRPVPSYSDTYPSAIGPAPERRRFLLGLLGAAGATAVALGSRRSRAATTRQERVDLHLGAEVGFGGCDYVVDRLIVQTRDAALATFLRTAAELPGLRTAALAELRNRACGEVTDRKRLAALEGRVGAALAARYRVRSRRAATAPVVNLVLTHRRPAEVDGGLGQPSIPVSPVLRRA